MVRAVSICFSEWNIFKNDFIFKLFLWANWICVDVTYFFLADLFLEYIFIRLLIDDDFDS